MRRVFAAFVLFCLVAAPAAAQPAVFLVRHAERADMATAGPAMMADDPDLSPAGQQRARALAKMLRDAGVGAIYTTEYRRTRLTAAPLAKELAVATTVVPSKDTAALVQTLKAAKGNVLVVGHSNTLPDIITALGVAEPIKIEESEFDNLFVVVQGSLIRLKY